MTRIFKKVYEKTNSNYILAVKMNLRNDCYSEVIIIRFIERKCLYNTWFANQTEVQKFAKSPRNHCPFQSRSIGKLFIKTVLINT